MNFPENLKYTREHEWVSVDGNTATIGVTDFAQQELGDIIYLDLNAAPEGTNVAKDAIFGSIEAIKVVSDLFSPISGEVIAYNDKLNQNPELVNSDPYVAGWIAIIRMVDFTELDDLLSAEEYKALIGIK